MRLQALPGSVAYQTVFDDSSRHLFHNSNTRAPLGVRAEILVRQYQLQTNHAHPLSILPYRPPEKPTWRLENVVCGELLSVRKSDFSVEQLRRFSADHIRNYHRNTYQIYTDGSRTEGGSGAGVFSDSVSLCIKLPNHASSFTAELYAVLEALVHLSTTEYRSCTIFTDSRSTLQLISNPASTHPIINDIQSHLIQLGRRVTFCWVPAHVGVTGNENADSLASTAASYEGPVDKSHVPYRDIYTVIKQKIFSMWQSEWSAVPTTNKLRSYRDTIATWPSSMRSNRRHERDTGT